MFTGSSRCVSIAFTLSLAFGPTCLHAQDEDQERSVLKQSHAFKEYRWIDEKAGECRLSGILTIFDHGYAIWTASSKTDRRFSEDIWHQSLEVFDSSNRRLFGFGVWDSPRMAADSQYNWRKTSTFPPGFYQDAVRAISSAEC
jgi:hypothetical protein